MEVNGQRLDEESQERLLGNSYSSESERPRDTFEKGSQRSRKLFPWKTYLALGGVITLLVISNALTAMRLLRTEKAEGERSEFGM